MSAGPGGAGAADTTIDGETPPVQKNTGGGGGAVGRIRINSDSTPSVSGALSPPTATTAAELGSLLARTL
jgi:hypothetical protein